MTIVPEPRVGHSVAPEPLARPHLADTTVWSKARNNLFLVEWFNAEVMAGRILTCEIVEMELLRSARNTAAFDQQVAMLRVLEHSPCGAEQVERARVVQVMLARTGRHRGVPPTDLVIAASAEAHGVTVLHYDHDFDLIAAVSGQPVRWVCPAGSLP